MFICPPFRLVLGQVIFFFVQKKFLVFMFLKCFVLFNMSWRKKRAHCEQKESNRQSASQSVRKGVDIKMTEHS